MAYARRCRPAAPPGGTPFGTSPATPNKPVLTPGVWLTPDAVGCASTWMPSIYQVHRCHVYTKCTQYTTETLPVKHRLKIVYTSSTPFLRRQHSNRASAVTDSTATDSTATDNTRSPDLPPPGVGRGGKGDLSAGGGIPATRQGSMRLPHEARAQSAQTGSPTRTKIPYR